MSNRSSLNAMSQKIGVVAAFVKLCRPTENVYAALV